MPNCIDYYEKLEKPLAPVLYGMEVRGVRVNLGYLRELKASLESQRRPLIDEITNELGSINLNSTKQVLQALNLKGITPEYKGKPSTDKRGTLYTRFAHEPVVKLMYQEAELSALLSGFVNPYLERNQEYVHPHFSQVGTRTGRLSCADPNLLNIPRKTENGKKVRKMFIPRDRMVMGDCDFGQIEPRLMAHLSKDPVMCEMFNNGVDFHTFTADRLGITRDKAKVLNLSVGYRATYKSVGAQLGVKQDDAQKQIDKWWDLFPALRRWQDRIIFDSKRSGFFTTLMGRRIRVEGLSEANTWKREAAERQLVNNIAQASAREVMATAMIKIRQSDEYLGLLIQVYDELVFESPNIDMAMDVVRECMENAVKLDVPLTVDCKTGLNWSDCH